MTKADQTWIDKLPRWLQGVLLVILLGVNFSIGFYSILVAP